MSLAEAWDQLPVVTRTLTGGAAVLFATTAVYPMAVFYLWFDWKQVLRLQIWRFATGLLSLQSRPNMGGLFAIFTFYNNLNHLETTKFRRRSDLLWYLAYVSGAFLLVGSYFGFYAYLAGITGALTYTVCQDSPTAPVRYLYVINTQSGFVPWLNLLLAVLMGGLPNGLETLLGIVIGHLYLYLTEIVPQLGGPNVLQPPERAERLARGPSLLGGRFQGKGHRLGE